MIIAYWEFVIQADFNQRGYQQIGRIREQEVTKKLLGLSGPVKPDQEG